MELSQAIPVFKLLPPLRSFWEAYLSQHGNKRTDPELNELRSILKQEGRLPGFREGCLAASAPQQEPAGGNGREMTRCMPFMQIFSGTTRTTD
jgi:hypothetical protein